MTRKDFLARLDEIMERAPGTTHADEVLASVDAWDSLALMSFIALVDSEFGVRVAGPRLAACKTVADLLAIVGDQVTD
jgi:acyl carrier protein